MTKEKASVNVIVTSLTMKGANELEVDNLEEWDAQRFHQAWEEATPATVIMACSICGKLMDHAPYVTTEAGADGYLHMYVRCEEHGKYARRKCRVCHRYRMSHYHSERNWVCRPCASDLKLFPFKEGSGDAVGNPD